MAKVLIVDDSYLNHKLIGVMLRRNKHTIVSAYNGVEAIKILSNTQVDMMITDINMPIMDGLTLLERVREDEHYGDLPVIVITADGQEYLHRIANEKGASGFLTQPFSSWELNRLVSDCLSARSLNQSQVHYIGL